MIDALAVPQPAPIGQRLLDPRVGVEDAESREDLDAVQEVAARPHRGVDVEAVLHAGIEVVRPVARRRVHRARSLVERHILSEHAHRIAVVERMPEPDAFERPAREGGHGHPEGAARARRDAGGQVLGHDHEAAIDGVGAVHVVRVKGNRQVRRDGPRRRRPDQDRDVPSLERRNPRAKFASAVGRDRELDVD